MKQKHESWGKFMRQKANFTIRFIAAFMLCGILASVACAATPISCGQVIADSISAAGEQDTYTFDAQANESITIRAAKTSGMLYPYLELYAPGGAKIANAASVIDKTLIESGTYTIVVKDEYNYYTGNYVVTWQRLNTPCSPVLDCGQIASGTIGTTSEQPPWAFYSFAAQANDSVTIRANKTSGSLYAYLELYAPGGTRIASSASVINKVLSAAGTYTVVIRDEYNYYTGNYCLTWQRLNNPCSPVINCGQNINGTIGATNQQPPWMFYSFDAEANDRISIRANKISGGLYAYLELYAPDGTNLTKASGKIDRTLAAAGRYTIVVRDEYSSYTGDFCLIWMRINNPCAAAINCNQVAAGSITIGERFKFYAFSAQANDIVTIRANKTSGGLYPYLELYTPEGANLAGAARVINKTLPVTGTYTVVLRDEYNSYLGDFIILWQKINNPCAATAITCGQNETGVIGASVLQAPWQFFYLDAAINDKITIRSAETSGGLYSYVELYAPDGTYLGGGGGKFDKTLIASGRYLVLVRDEYNSYTGNFAFTWQKLINPCNSNNIVFGQSASGNLDFYSKMIPYKFTASANDKIYIALAELTETAGYFDPDLELYDSSGTKITSTISSGAFRATIPQAGEYSLFVADSYRDGSGTYEITLQRPNNPANAENLNYNTLTEDSLETFTGINVYSFTANAGDIVTICSSVKTTTSGYFGTYLELFDSSGARLAYGYSSLKTTFTAGGTFYLFVRDDGRDGTGIYRIKLLNGDFSCWNIDFIEPQVTLANPVGGEIIESGSTYTINWASSDNVGITSQEIRLSTDGGATYPTVIASGLASAIQSFDWEVPLALSANQGRIKIIALDAAGNEGHDESGSDFSVIITAELPPDIQEMNYEYDKLNRLKRSISDRGIESFYTYDALGNRLTLDTSGAQEWDLILPVPWYQEERAYYSAAASCKMTLDYIRQDTALTQDELYNYAAAGQTRQLDPLDVAAILNRFKPSPYNFSIISKSAITDAMRDIAHWMDYEVPDTSIPNCSVVIPTFGAYDNWMTVRGASASQDPNANINLWDTAEFTVYGFWLNDPAISGIGENSYKTAAELQSTYYLLLATGDAYTGKFVAVAEPPEKKSQARVKIAQPFCNQFHNELRDIASADAEISNDSEQAEKAPLFPYKYKRFDWKRIVDPRLLKDKSFQAATKGVFSRRPLKVKMLEDPAKFYYLVPLDKSRGKNTLTSAVLVMDGSDFSFKEASWVKTPVKFPNLSKREAITLIKKSTSTQAFIGKRKAPEKARAELVWQPGEISSSPYRPFWRVTIGNNSWFVTEEGSVRRAK